jgi:hypothetical protein
VGVGGGEREVDDLVIFRKKSEDGKIILRDGRIESRLPSAQMTLQNDCEVTGVRWNPCMENLFATSDNRGRVCLRDIRTSFGSALNRTRQPLEQVRFLFFLFFLVIGLCPLMHVRR